MTNEVIIEYIWCLVPCYVDTTLRTNELSNFLRQNGGYNFYDFNLNQQLTKTKIEIYKFKFRRQRVYFLLLQFNSRSAYMI